MTNKELIQLEIDMKEMPNALQLLLRPKIQQFKRDNGIRIASVRERLNNINKQFRVCDEDGNPHMCNGKPVMLEGKTWEDYIKATDELLNQEVHLVL